MSAEKECFAWQLLGAGYRVSHPFPSPGLSPHDYCQPRPITCSGARQSRIGVGTDLYSEWVCLSVLGPTSDFSVVLTVFERLLAGKWPSRCWWHVLVSGSSPTQGPRLAPAGRDLLAACRFRSY